MVLSNNKDAILEHIKSYKSRALVPLICFCCGKEFSKPKQKLQLALNTKKRNIIFCSSGCSSKNKEIGQYRPCANCNTLVKRTPSSVKRNKSENVFCSQSCSAKFNNTHKKHGTRRSKLEAWLEDKLLELYPNMYFLFNDKSSINSELDIYIPELKLAFELNGIFHYEPIFGDEKLSQIKNNDNNKFQKCQQANISLCIIDVSWIKYNKESNFRKILDIIIEIVTRHSKTTLCLVN